MTCLDDDTLAQLVKGALSAERREEANEHIDRCDRCRALMAELAQMSLLPIADTEPAIAEEPDQIAPGSLVGRYEVQGVLGAGGMSVVYQARDPDLDRDVALKVLAGGDRALQPRLQVEAKALAKLSHPNVVAVYEIGRYGECNYIAMELVQGRTLAEWLERRRSWQEVIEVLTAAGRGLVAAHEAGLIHRDIKPANILIGDDGRVRVTDFGLARPMQDGGVETSDAAPISAAPASLTSTGMTVGTPAYMAPEQYLAERVDKRVDQFGFCVTLYQSLYGHRPFDGRDVSALREAVLTGDIRPPPADRPVPASVHRVVLRGLRRDRAERFASMRELLDALHVPEPSRARWLIAFAAATSVAALGYGLTREPSPPTPNLTPSASVDAAPPAPTTVTWIPIRGGRQHLDGGIYGKGDVDVRDFELTRSEVTVAQYRACVNAGPCKPPSGVYAPGRNFVYGRPGFDRHPVTMVDWKQAWRFCEHIGGRLPTEAEWQHAARSGGDREYPWGAERPSCDRAVILDVDSIGCGAGTSLAVCSKPAGNTEQGLCDMVGNVTEWVWDCFEHPFFSRSPPDKAGPETMCARSTRGGYYASYGKDLNTTQRGYNPQRFAEKHIGIRCAR